MKDVLSFHLEQELLWSVQGLQMLLPNIQELLKQLCSQHQPITVDAWNETTNISQNSPAELEPFYLFIRSHNRQTVKTTASAGLTQHGCCLDHGCLQA